MDMPLYINPNNQDPCVLAQHKNAEQATATPMASVDYGTSDPLINPSLRMTFIASHSGVESAMIC
jgi:hypothetical protein